MPDGGRLIGELMRHPLAALFIAQGLRVHWQGLDKAAHQLGPLTKPDVAIAGMAGAAIFAASHVLLEQGQAELGGEAIEHLHGPRQIRLAGYANESGVKIDAGQSIGKGIDTLPQRPF
ncbi:hypothetical protein D3C72_1841590 [compost metagenome]